jgi:hypothetical protein
MLEIVDAIVALRWRAGEQECGVRQNAKIPNDDEVAASTAMSVDKPVPVHQLHITMKTLQNLLPQEIPSG